jgi:hypothetical protein
MRAFDCDPRLDHPVTDIISKAGKQAQDDPSGQRYNR